MERLPLTVGVDGSESGLDALDWAVDEAARHGLPLHVVHASLWQRYEGFLPSVSGAEAPYEQRVAEGVIAAAAERAKRRDPEVRVTTEIVSDDPVTALLNAGRGASALVTGSRGRGGVIGMLLGSSSLAVASRAACPVVVVRGQQANREGAFGRVTLAVGEGEEDQAAVRFAFREAMARECELYAVRAWRHPAHEMPGHPLYRGQPAHAYHDRALAVLDTALRSAMREHPEVSVNQRAGEGSARDVLVNATADSDLLVLGVRRREGHLGLQLGLVDHAVLHHAACPVAVVPEHL